MKVAATLAAFALSGATASAQTVPYQIYTLVVGDSPQSAVIGVLRWSVHLGGDTKSRLRRAREIDDIRHG